MLDFLRSKKKGLFTRRKQSLYVFWIRQILICLRKKSYLDTGDKEYAARGKATICAGNRIQKYDSVGLQGAFAPQPSHYFPGTKIILFRKNNQRFFLLKDNDLRFA